jgi:outer membrane immunogenic protein
MKKLAAMAFLISSPAMAGDSWTGFYTGINAGYGTGDYKTTSQSFTSGSTEQFSNYTIVYPTVATSSTSRSFVSGGVAGAQVGYNKQFANNFVLGIDGDMNWANVFDRQNYSNSNGAYANVSAYSNSAGGYNSYGKTGLDWFGTVRGKAGYAFGNFMPYFTAGLAFGQTSSSGNGSFYNTSWGSAIGTGSGAKTSAGWAVGAGAEYKLNKNWSVKGEYLYTNLSGPTSSGAGQSNKSATFGSSKISDFGVSRARVGINYHFDLF